MKRSYCTWYTGMCLYCLVMCMFLYVCVCFRAIYLSSTVAINLLHSLHVSNDKSRKWALQTNSYK